MSAENVSTAPVPSNDRAPRRKLDAESRIAALVKEVRQLRARVKELELETDSSRRQENLAMFNAGVERLRAGIPDFDATLSRLRPLPAELMSELVDNDAGPTLLYRLAQYPALAGELLALAPRAARHKIRRLCAEIEQQAEQQAKVAAAEAWYRESAIQHFSSGRS
jgi:hypothetical protein